MPRPAAGIVAASRQTVEWPAEVCEPPIGAFVPALESPCT